MEDLIIRCSSLSNLMVNPSSGNELAVGTKTWLKKLAKEDHFNYKPNISSKPIVKGNDCEEVSIELRNKVYFKNTKKNTERKTSSWLTGECDLVEKESVDDIKTSWSLETFPAFTEDAEKLIKKSGYDWQGRGYMLLWEKPKAKVTYCMVDTPNYLLTEYDDLSIHKVSHIDPKDRETTVVFNRDKDIEVKMFERYKIANKYYKECRCKLKNK